MSLWVRRRGEDGRLRTYAVEGIPTIAALCLSGVGLLIWLAVVLVDYFTGVD